MTAKLPTGNLTLNDINKCLRDLINDVAGVTSNVNADVVGPGTVTSGNLAVFDGTTGKLLAQVAATTASIPDSADRRYVTDAEEAVIDNTSGTNTGDQIVPTIGGSTTGTVDALVLTPSPALGAYVTGSIVTFTNSTGSNDGSATLNISGLGAKTIRVNTQGSPQPLTGGEMQSSNVYTAIYTGSEFILQNPNFVNTENFIVAASDETTALIAANGVVSFRMPYAFVLTGVKASVNTAATGATLLAVDINAAGTSVLDTVLTFDASELTTVTATTPAAIHATGSLTNQHFLAADAVITVDIDAVGSTIAGAGLKVTLLGHQ